MHKAIENIIETHLFAKRVHALQQDVRLETVVTRRALEQTLVLVQLPLELRVSAWIALDNFKLLNLLRQLFLDLPSCPHFLVQSSSLFLHRADDFTQSEGDLIGPFPVLVDLQGELGVLAFLTIDQPLATTDFAFQVRNLLAQRLFQVLHPTNLFQLPI